MRRVNNTVDKFGRQRVKQGVCMRGLPGVGFRLSPDGQYDIEGKVLTNVANPTNSTDVVTKDYLLTKLEELSTKIIDVVTKDYLRTKLEELSTKIIDENLSNVRDDLKNVQGIHHDILWDLEKRMRKMEG